MATQPPKPPNPPECPLCPLPAVLHSPPGPAIFPLFVRRIAGPGHPRETSGAPRRKRIPAFQRPVPTGPMRRNKPDEKLIGGQQVGHHKWAKAPEQRQGLCGGPIAGRSLKPGIDNNDNGLRDFIQQIWRNRPVRPQWGPVWPGFKASTCLTARSFDRKRHSPSNAGRPPPPVCAGYPCQQGTDRYADEWRMNGIPAGYRKPAVAVGRRTPKTEARPPAGHFSVAATGVVNRRAADSGYRIGGETGHANRPGRRCSPDSGQPRLRSPFAPPLN